MVVQFAKKPYLRIFRSKSFYISEFDHSGKLLRIEGGWQNKSLCKSFRLKFSENYTAEFAFCRITLKRNLLRNSITQYFDPGKFQHDNQNIHVLNCTFKGIYGPSTMVKS